jgi:lysophospholipase L1-like esterase
LESHFSLKTENLKLSPRPLPPNMKLKSFAFVFAVVILTLTTRAADDQSAPATTTNTPAIADTNTYLANLRLELQKTWPTNHTLNIVCHGHSVPAGYARTPEVRTFDAYPHLLQAALCQRYPHAVINVIVTAIGGEQSEQGAARFDRDVLSLRPDLITIDYALNDRRMGLARSEHAWRGMIEKALARHIPVILLTPTADESAHLDDPADPLNQHAVQIRRLAAEYHLALVDSLAQFKDYVHQGGKLADLMAQGNHPNRAGHQLVATQLLNWF